MSERGARLRDAFERAVRGVLDQGAPARAPNGRPAFIDGESRRCPVGWLLSEEEAHRAETNALDPCCAELARAIFGDSAGEPERELLELLRRAHDESVPFASDFADEFVVAVERIRRWLDRGI